MTATGTSFLIIIFFQNIFCDFPSGIKHHFKLKTDNFTNGARVLEFEKKWSKWLGVKYSTFVNSGASANLLSLKILRDLIKNKNEVIVPVFTWNSDIVSIVCSGFKPIFVDINLNNLAMNEDLIKKK